MGKLASENAARRVWDLGLLIRMQTVVGSATFREIGGVTGVHPETVRRYLTDGRPSAYFLAGLCRMFNVSPSQLLFGIADELSAASPFSQSVRDAANARGDDESKMNNVAGCMSYEVTKIAKLSGDGFGPAS